MRADVLPLLLHQGGWDEVIMVAVGLGLAYLVIVWSGRRRTDDDEAEDDADDAAEGSTAADATAAADDLNGGPARPIASPAEGPTEGPTRRPA